MSRTAPGDRRAAPSQSSVVGAPPKPETPEGPVAWLFGRQLLASMKWILLYTAFGSKLDPRDWMRAQVFPPEDGDKELKGWRERSRLNPRDLLSGVEYLHADELAGAAERLAQEGKSADDEFWSRRGEFWFDYISDTGDGMKATYSVAYLCLNDLYVKELFARKPAPGDSSVLLDCEYDPEGVYQVPLPRGEFLLVGGDTAYHLSDYESLDKRFVRPFMWAFDDLKRDLESAGRRLDETRRPLFGIPANHDYYDMLDGFVRQFRRPLKSDDGDYGEKDKTAPQLRIPGFKRLQEASYLALRLPFGWWLWGLDTEVGAIDERQRHFFRGLCRKDAGDPERERIIPPDKLIVCTCVPTTVFGQYANEGDEKATKAFLQLGLPRPFLPRKKLRRREETLVVIEPGQEHPVRLPPGQIRLDIAGDIHHYARYWGPRSPRAAAGDMPPPRSSRRKVRAGAPHMDNYASVVAGLGGAFHHPTTTYADEVREQVLYPRERQSRPVVAAQLFNPLRIWRGGSVGLFGIVLAFVIYFAAAPSLAPSSAQMINNSLPFTLSGVSRYEPFTPTIQDEDPPHGEPGGYVLNRHFKEVSSEGRYWGYLLGWALVLASLPLIASTFRVCWRRHRELKKEERTTQEARLYIGKLDEVLRPRLVANVIISTVGALLLSRHRHELTPFESSILVLFSFFWAATSLVLSSMYSDWLFEHAANDEVTEWDWRVTWLLTALAVFSVVAGLWIFGRHNLSAYLFTDIVFMLLTISTAALLVALAITVGGVMLRGRARALMFFVGAWHALLQLAVPFLLVRKGTWLTLVLAGALIFVFARIGRRLLEDNSRKWLVIAWAVYGALMLMLPYVVWALTHPDRPSSLWFLSSPHDTLRFDELARHLSLSIPPDGQVADLANGRFASYVWWNTLDGWWALLPAVGAGAIGALMSCVWFGWYLAVCLGFNGHNNEAGGAAMSERFKGFIRFRLTEHDLTGYVIAVDDPEFKGRDLKPQIVDAFRLTRGPGGGQAAATPPDAHAGTPGPQAK